MPDFNNNPWKISAEAAKIFRKKHLKETLDLFNQLNANTYPGYYYMIDYTDNRFVLGDFSTQITSGYSTNFLTKGSREDFYQRILNPSEWNWYLRMGKELRKIFFSYSQRTRKSIEVSYDLIVSNQIGKELILRNKLVPYQLDKNGNLWLSLGYVSFLPIHLPTSAKAVIVNHQTGDFYEFNNKKFVLKKTKALTSEDIQILKWMSEDLSSEQICEYLKVSESSFKRKRLKLFNKMEVRTSAGATYKAHSLGLI